MLIKSERFEPYEPIMSLAKKASRVVSLCNNMGEGWLLTAEMIDLIEHGTSNIVCAQPFACLPNHVVGKSVIKRLRQMYPESNIVAVDYDPGASEVNQLNRIKLMISVAKENFKENGGFKLQNDDDPTMRQDWPVFEERHRPGQLDDSIVNEGGCCDIDRGQETSHFSLHLTDEQLAEIERAKVEVGAK